LRKKYGRKKLGKGAAKNSQTSFLEDKHKDYHKLRGRVSANKFCFYYFPSDNKKLKTNVKRTGKYINIEKTPPIHPRKNPVAKITCPSLIDHLKLQKEVF
jgi:hypothetical protein